jgi:hypothetical protein
MKAIHTWVSGVVWDFFKHIELAAAKFPESGLGWARLSD